MINKKVTPLILDSYLAAVRNSVGARTYRNFYAKVEGRREEILNDGDLACAWFASSILAMFGLVKRTHTTVKATVEDLKQSDWKRIKKPEIGSVLIWEPADQDGKGIHKHIGFYLGGKRAVSNSSKFRHPVIHHWTFGKIRGRAKRKVEAIYWNKKLDG